MMCATVWIQPQATVHARQPSRGGSRSNHVSGPDSQHRRHPHHHRLPAIALTKHNMREHHFQARRRRLVGFGVHPRLLARCQDFY